MSSSIEQLAQISFTSESDNSGSKDSPKVFSPMSPDSFDSPPQKQFTKLQIQDLTASRKKEKKEMRDKFSDSDQSVDEMDMVKEFNQKIRGMHRRHLIERSLDALAYHASLKQHKRR
jgi:hypothetical protein